MTGFLCSSESMNNTPKTFNARFDKEVHLAIASLLGAWYGRDKTEVVTRAILEADARMTGFESPLLARFNGARAVSEPPSGGKHALSAPDLRGSQPASVPFQGGSEPSAAPFTRSCVHCGDSFGAWNRKADTCIECKSVGHGGDPRNCPPCTAGSGI